ncbi:putative flavoprotein involved in K+ transport [Saccharomonospora marina XMU15]|uniref:Putative flavoprotein involved in K+ transport n=1 Tax=Saccharomonospora marina XMU15 TaxID=882083 RepID=H5X9N0_9PSEU|nr:NAD(P)/FAD-dependent oxidoreductase [Saccharomonospora marina]EHR51468.1 putative flavoprotein involved in K+ transport [Saccharomonospora marina XMU15]
MDTISTTALIVGAGFGGVAMAIELRRAGIHDFVVLEKADRVGGVWRANTYPGSGCDVPSPLYSYSFARNRSWPRRYSEQADIHAYLERTAARFGVLNHVRFGSEVATAEFDENSGTWLVRTTDGEQFATRVFIPATGQLSRPAYPPIPGIDSFQGSSFHSAEWNHDCDLTGKRVAVVGTGASAIQFVPKIQPNVGKLAVFQRSAQYIMPKRDHDYTAWHRRFLRLAALQTLDRLLFWLYAEFAQLCLSKWRVFTPLFLRQTSKHLREQVPDEELRRKLTPDYELGCKRVLFSNDYLPALTKSNVELVTERIVEITPTGLRTAGGTEYAADVIIYATGFAARELLAPMKVHGVGHRPLSQSWSEGARAHLGITVPGFPNMFLMYGPNTNLGGGSIIYMLESQARYIGDAVRKLVRHPGHYLDVRAEAEQRWDDEVQARLERSVWTRCSSWYRNEHGRVVSNWPGRTGEYRKRTRAVELADFEVHTTG